ncbi:MAG: acyl-CoA dehydrogenase family protein, partial [Microvirga sp.]
MLGRIENLLPVFAADAAERDRLGGRPTAQILAIKKAGLTNLLIPRELGGHGLPWSTALRVVRALSRVDGSLGHLFGYHCLCLMGMWGRTDPAHARRVLARSARAEWWWGNSNDPLSPTVKGHRVRDGYRVNGVRPFSSGSHVADYLQISWQDEGTGSRVMAAVPVSIQGVIVNDDWDGLGQRQTGSGTVTFEDAFVADEFILDIDYKAGAPFKTIGASLAQSVLVNLFVGSAEGALQVARDYTLAKSRPWRTSGVERHVDDPWIKRR